MNARTWSLLKHLEVGTFLAISVMALLLTLARTASAQNFAMDRFTIAGGGSVSTGGVYSVKGTVGQPEAGVLRGGNYTGVGGFWGVALAVQEPGAPFLRLTRSGGDVRISWPSTATGFQLQETTSLAPPISWGAVLQTPVPVNGEYTVTVPAAAGARFYRLRKP